MTLADEQWDRRRALERQLHDGPALRIAALTLHLGLLAETHRGIDLRRDIAELQGQLHLVLQELRAIGDQLYPPLLREAGLGPAISELADQSQIRVTVDAGDRFGSAAEGVAYFAVRELLQGLAPATRTVDITVRRDSGGLTLDLAGVDTARGVAVRDRIRWLGGTVETAGTIRVRVPCE